MSELRRAARRLVEPRTESFETDYTVEESQRRLEAALAKLPEAERSFRASWSGGDGDAAMLTATFEPSRRTQRFLKAFSLAMALLMALALASWFVADGALPWLATITAILAFLFFPFVILGISSHQDARESRIKRAIRIALKDEDEKLPAPQRWADED
jgi:hypothetical protein